MKSRNYKFVRCVSLISLAVATMIVVVCVIFSIYAVNRIIENADFWGIMFAVIMVFSDIIGVLMIKEVLSNGVKFYDDYVEFTGVDTDNVYKYDDIEKVEASRDTKASFRKNFVDRYSNVSIYLKDESMAYIQLGLTSGRTLKKIIDELTLRMDTTNNNTES